MNPQAFDIIDALGLNKPKVFTLEELANSEESNFYIRYNRTHSSTNEVLNKHEIINNIEYYSNLVNTGKIIVIESTYNQNGGGISLVTDSFSYTEFVLGHSSGLLRRGLCGIRLLINDNEHKIIHTNQKWITNQRLP
jgi:hypothetical protein